MLNFAADKKETEKEVVMDLKGKVALVTGAGAGIGLGCAIKLALAGGSVILNDVVGNSPQSGDVY